MHTLSWLYMDILETLGILTIVGGMWLHTVNRPLLKEWLNKPRKKPGK